VSPKDEEDIKQGSEWVRHAGPDEDEPRTRCLRKAGLFITINLQYLFLLHLANCKNKYFFAMMLISSWLACAFVNV
jgi:hypothetical protein